MIGWWVFRISLLIPLLFLAQEYSFLFLVLSSTSIWNLDTYVVGFVLCMNVVSIGMARGGPREKSFGVFFPR